MSKTEALMRAMSGEAGAVQPDELVLFPDMAADVAEGLVAAVEAEYAELLSLCELFLSLATSDAELICKIVEEVARLHAIKAGDLGSTTPTDPTQAQVDAISGSAYTHRPATPTDAEAET